MSTKSDTVARIVIALGEAFRQSVTEVTINAYRVGLEGLSEKELQRAGKTALQTCKFMPSPSELRNLAGVVKPADLALQAWTDVQQSFSIGAYKTVDFEDCIINAVIRSLGGWPAMFEQCGDSEGEKWYRHNFLKTYESMALGRVDGEVCQPLPGLSQASGVVRDREGKVERLIPPTPRRIGCGHDQRRRIASTVRATIPEGRPAELPTLELRKA